MPDFSFEQYQLLNSFFAGTAAEDVNKDSIIKRLANAISNTDDKDLISIAESTINKIRFMDNKSVVELIGELPQEEVE
jgi:hypothetical protein